jgi:uncharacterized protein (DUF849 family)
MHLTQNVYSLMKSTWSAVLVPRQVHDAILALLGFLVNVGLELVLTLPDPALPDLKKTASERTFVFEGLNPAKVLEARRRFTCPGINFTVSTD